MTRGRKRKPTAAKILNGSAKVNPGRINKNEPDHLLEPAQCPPHLDDIAKQEWAFMVAVLDGMGLFSKSYRAALEIYCESYSNYRRALDAVSKYGQVLVSKKVDGTIDVRRNPFSMEVHKYKDECKAFLIEFGLTPSAKTKVTADQVGMSQAELARQMGIGIAKRTRGRA